MGDVGEKGERGLGLKAAEKLRTLLMPVGVLLQSKYLINVC